MRQNLLTALKFVFFYERYWSDVKSDPGGLTIWGICSRDWPNEVAAMKNMSREDAQNYAEGFYERNYWNKIDGDALPDLMDIVLMDCAVNQGVGRVRQIAPCAWDWRDVLLLREDKYDDFKSFDRFGRGWSRRLISLRDYIASNYAVLKDDSPELIKAER